MNNLNVGLILKTTLTLKNSELKNNLLEFIMNLSQTSVGIQSNFVLDDEVNFIRKNLDYWIEKYIIANVLIKKELIEDLKQIKYMFVYTLEDLK